MKTNFKLMTDKIGKDGLCPIFVRSRHNGKEFKFFTGENVRLKIGTCTPKKLNEPIKTTKISTNVLIKFLVILVFIYMIVN